MRKITRGRRLGVITAALVAVIASTAGTASASHSWNNYHWQTNGTDPLQLRLGDNLTPNWDQDLRTASVDWSVSSVLNTSVAPGNTRPKTCRPTAGMVEVCNAEYGPKGWLGLAQIWLQNGHILQGTAKMNDTYFSTPAYNKPDKRLHVMCQEVGHTFGLGHQDESGASLGTCMDYASDSTNSQHPNAHDYEQLELLYAHADSTQVAVSARGASAVDVDERREWGRMVERHGDHEVFIRHFGNGLSVVTFVTGLS